MLDPMCVYKTPCGWCSKFDKKCDNKIPECKSNKKDDNSKWLSQAQIDTAFAEKKNKRLTVKKYTKKIKASLIQRSFFDFYKKI